MVTGNDVLSFLNTCAPLTYQMEFDNSGFLVGDRGAEIHRVLVALDITSQVISEAESIGAQLIVSHHPLIFHPLSAVCADDPTGRKVMRLIRSGISAICMHTNLDIAEGGVNDALMEALDAKTTDILEPSGTDNDGKPLGCGRIGFLKQEMDLEPFLQFVGERLRVNGVRYVPGGRPVHQIAVCGGSGGSMLELAASAGCDTLLTADVKYDRFLTAQELGVNLIDADHFCTENVIVPKLAERIRHEFPDLHVTISDLKQTVCFYAAQ